MIESEHDKREAAVRKIDEQVARAAVHAEKMQALASRISSVDATARSRNDELAVTVDVAGRLLDVTFSERALGLGHERLSEVLLATVREAYRSASAQSVDLAVDVLGEDAPTVVKLRNDALANTPSLPSEREDGPR